METLSVDLSPIVTLASFTVETNFGFDILPFTYLLKEVLIAAKSFLEKFFWFFDKKSISPTLSWVELLKLKWSRILRIY